MRNVHRTLVRQPEVKKPSEDLGVNGEIILKRMLKKLGGRFWAGYEARSVSNTVKF
jgi:hypothetical protein